MRSRPFLLVAAAYALGIVAGAAVALPPRWLLGLGLVLALVAVSFGRFQTVTFWPLLVCAGAANFIVQTAVLSPLDLRACVGGEPRLVRLRGRLIEAPSLRIAPGPRGPTEHTLVTVAAMSLTGEGNDQPVRGRVLARVPGPLGPEFFNGRQVEVTGVLELPPRAAAEGLFDYRSYLRWLGIHYELVTEGAQDWRTDDPPGVVPQPPWSDRFLAWAQATLARGLPVEDEPLRLLWGMTLGWRTGLTDEVSLPFMQTGTMHIFAISGLHIALIAGMLVALLRVLQVPRGACGLVVLPLIWLYTAATGWQASAIRSTIMMSVIVVGWALRRPGDLLNSLAVSAFLILLWDPTQIFQASFQLSFFVVLSMAVLLPPLEQLRWRWCQPDPLRPRNRQPRWRIRLAPVGHWLSTNLAVSVAAWLGSLPLVAHYFHLVTPVSLLANLVIVPLSGVALMANLASLVCGGWLPWATVRFNHAAWFGMQGMVWFSERAAALPGAWFHARSPGADGFVVWYGLMATVGTGWLLARARRRGLVAVGIVVTGWAVVRVSHEWSRCEVTVLASSRGGVANWIAPGLGHGILVDCGDESGAGFVVVPFLGGQGVNRLPNFIVTHGDVHRMGGWARLAADFRPHRVFTGPVIFRSPSYRRLTAELERWPDHWRRVHDGDEVDGWLIRHPPANSSFGVADDLCLVLDGRPAGVRVLLLGDLGERGQHALAQAAMDLRCDILVAGIPSNGEPLGPELLAVLQPAVIILTDPAGPAPGQVTAALRERLGAGDRRVFYTSQTGSLTLRFFRGRWQVGNLDGVLARGQALADRATGGEARR